MPNKTLDDLFVDHVKDLFYAERKILDALPKMASASVSTDLASAFEEHRLQTETHVSRLKKVFEIVGSPARGKTCPAIDGIIEEGEEVMKSYKNTPAVDAGLIAAAQAIEHYEIARYGTLCRWADLLGHDEAVTLLKQTLAEEEETDQALSALAEGSVNQAALESA